MNNNRDIKEGARLAYLLKTRRANPKRVTRKQIIQIYLYICFLRQSGDKQLDRNAALRLKGLPNSVLRRVEELLAIAWCPTELAMWYNRHTLTNTNGRATMASRPKPRAEEMAMHTISVRLPEDPVEAAQLIVALSTEEDQGGTREGIIFRELLRQYKARPLEERNAIREALRESRQGNEAHVAIIRQFE